MPKICDWPKHQKHHSSKSIEVIRLIFYQNDYPKRGLFWQKDNFVNAILFELCLFLYLVQSQILLISLYLNYSKYCTYIGIYKLFAYYSDLICHKKKCFKFLSWMFLIHFEYLIDVGNTYDEISYDQTDRIQIQIRAVVVV